MSQIEIRDVAIEYKKPKSDETFAAIQGHHSLDREEFLRHHRRIERLRQEHAVARPRRADPPRARLDPRGRQEVTGPGPDRAMVFQDASLLPWRSVQGNVCFGLELQRWTRDDIRGTGRRFVRMVGLEGFSDYHPHQLSGGMRQRVNIARALAVDPDCAADGRAVRRLDAQTAR
jgi:NitT/TauT family transport system ATP-binding protein